MNQHIFESNGLNNQEKAKILEVQTWILNYLAEELELQPEAIDINLPFERYGLDSSAAIFFTGDLQDWLGCELDPELLFDYQTVSDLTQYLVDSDLLNLDVSVKQNVKENTICHQEKNTEVYSLSHNQQALWFIYKLSPSNSAYNVAFTTRIVSKVDKEALSNAFQTLIDRHPLLRTNFKEQDSQILQEVSPQKKVYFEEIDARSCEENTLQEKVINSYKRPFDLENGPVMRVSLFSKSEEDHVLLITLHHIICDGWSVWMLLDELKALYIGLKENQTANLPPLKFSYQDYVNWQSEMLANEKGEKLLNYWKNQLSGDLPVLNLPTDKPRPAVQTYNGSSHQFSINRELSQQLKELANKEGVSLFMLLLAAYQVLLYRYTNQEDILIGVPMKCRHQSEFARVFGYFVNPVVIRADLSKNPSFKDFLHQIRHQVVGAITHQDYPFPLLVNKLQTERSSSRTSIFQADFVLQKPQKSEEVLDILAFGKTEKKINWGALELQSFFIPQEEGQFDLSLEMLETQDKILGILKYNQDLFDDSTIQRMEQNFQVLLQDIVEYLAQNVSHLSIVSNLAKENLVKQASNKVSLRNQCIHHLFEQQVKKTPDNVAIIFNHKQLTYRELNSRANRLAHHLQSLGVTSEVFVGVYLERSLETIVTLLGILKAGGAYVPIDPKYPQERISYILEDAQTPIVVTQEKLASKLSNTNVKKVLLDKDWQNILQQNDDNVVTENIDSNLAYIIYTSGSTGKPKGVMVEHRSLVNFTSRVQEEYQIVSTDKVLQFASISFDAAAEEIYPCLTCGATLILRTDEMLSSIETFLSRCKEYKITVLDLPTAYWHQLTVDLVAKKLELPPSLRLTIIGGEGALPERILMWQQYVGKNPVLLNTYGPTEATVVATKYNLSNAVSDKTDSWRVPIGKPLGNIEVYVLDRYGQILPIGIPGELYIGGVCLARGYLNQPELTEQKFISNPFDNDPKSRLYKTGDLVRYLPDGNLEFLGRIDNQVKIRGFRIELGEIESVLTQYLDIRDAVVLVDQDKNENKRLVSYLVSDGGEKDVTSIRSFLQDNLPDYMIPSLFIWLDEIPLTTNGKLDRKSLPEPNDIQRNITDEIIIPRDDIELQLTAIWSDLLGLETIGVTDNFFDLGGHSILAIQLISKIKDVFDRDIPLSSLLQNGTIENIANILRSSNTDISLSPLVKMQPLGHKSPFFCIHPGGGNVFCYRELAASLGKERPFYGIQAKGLNSNDSDKKTLNTIPEMAEYYIEAIKKVQPQSPYYLGGWCTGGVVALEMARQLQQKGEEVALLVLIETYLPVPIQDIELDKKRNLLEQVLRIHLPDRNNFDDDTLLIMLFAWDLGSLFGKEIPLSMEEIEEISSDTRLKYILKKAKLLGIVPPQFGFEEINNLWQVFCANVRAMYSYEAQTYSGKTLILQAKEELKEMNIYPVISWDEVLTGEITKYEIIGDHYSIMQKPNVLNLAIKLQNYLG